MDFQFKSKFNLEDVVWFMKDNKPVQGIIKQINYSRSEYVDIRCRHKSVFAKLKSFIEDARCRVQILYEMDIVNNDGECKSSSYYQGEDEMYKSKEELLKSL